MSPQFFTLILLVALIALIVDQASAYYLYGYPYAYSYGYPAAYYYGKRASGFFPEEQPLP